MDTCLFIFVLLPTCPSLSLLARTLVKAGRAGVTPLCRKPHQGGKVSCEMLRGADGKHGLELNTQLSSGLVLIHLPCCPSCQAVLWPCSRTGAWLTTFNQAEATAAQPRFGMERLVPGSESSYMVAEQDAFSCRFSPMTAVLFWVADPLPVLGPHG